MEKIFRLDTWKVFALTILPFLFPDSEFGFCLDFAYLIFCLCWYYYLAYELFIRLPEEHDMNFKKFKFHFFLTSEKYLKYDKSFTIQINNCFILS